MTANDSKDSVLGPTECQALSLWRVVGLHGVLRKWTSHQVCMAQTELLSPFKRLPVRMRMCRSRTIEVQASGGGQSQPETESELHMAATPHSSGTGRGTSGLVRQAVFFMYLQGPSVWSSELGVLILCQGSILQTLQESTGPYYSTM